MPTRFTCSDDNGTAFAGGLGIVAFWLPGYWLIGLVGDHYCRSDKPVLPVDCIFTDNFS
jgi:hypothetical protein